MKWLAVLLLLAFGYVGLRWFEARLRRRWEPKGRHLPPAAGAVRAPSPEPPPAVDAPRQPDRRAEALSRRQPGRGLSAVAEGADDGSDSAPTDLGTSTADDWGVQTVVPPEPPARGTSATPAAEPAAPPASAVARPSRAAEDAVGRTLDPAGLAEVALAPVRAALAQGKAPPPDQVEALAADPLTRLAVYRALKDARSVSLIPRKHRSQKAMAEADLAMWLQDSRLGARPDAIELVETFTRQTADGDADWYLFRFRSDRRDFEKRGWMAGVSGPWIRSEGPGGGAHGDSGSDFEPWSAASDEEREAAVREVMEAWEPAAK